MTALFQSLSELLEKVEVTQKSLEIIAQTANYLKTLSAEEVEPATNMMVGIPKIQLKSTRRQLVNPHPHKRPQNPEEASTIGQVREIYDRQFRNKGNTTAANREAVKVDEAEKKGFAKEFYSRQTILKELGEKGQQKLAKSKVAVVGAGGLGTVSSLYLALAGVGYIRLIDQDTIETHNLHRQILYNPDDLHYPKTEVAAKRLEKQNPLVTVEAVPENVNADNVERLLKGVDCVVDGLDNMVTRYLVNRACVKLKIPYVFGAAIGIEGNLSVFAPPETGCLECLMPNLSDFDLLSCNTRGVLGATTGIIGALQAMETIKLLSGVGSTLKGKLMVCDFSDIDFTVIDISKSTRCPVCHGEISSIAGGERLVWLCGKDTANINPEKPLKLNLDEVYPQVSRQFNVRLKSRLALMFDYKSCEVSFFSGGRMLIKGVTDEKTALTVYREILKKLESST